MTELTFGIRYNHHSLQIEPLSISPSERIAEHWHSRHQLILQLLLYVPPVFDNLNVWCIALSVYVFAGNCECRMILETAIATLSSPFSVRLELKLQIRLTL